jgi:ectoine hydroxylase-related dioxygenase (phytanoyl-CoA dioxygenase family)
MVNFLPNKGRLFRELMCHPSIMEFAKHIFRGVPFYLASQNGVILRNGATEQILHVDQQAWPFLTPIPVTFVAVLALTDFEPEMGSTYFAPATHHRPPPRIGIDASGAVVTQESVATRAVSAPAGSLLVWEGRVWHGQGASRSDRDRLSVIQGYSMHMVRPQDDFAASIHDGVYEQLTDEQKRVLGFNVEFEYTGRIGPRNADDRRTNLNFHFPYVPELRRDSAARAIMRGDMRIDHVARQAELIAQPGTPA